MRHILVLFLLLLCSKICYSQTRDCKILYSESGKESAYPRLSNDKGRILFQSNRSGNWQLYVIDTGKVDPTIVAADSSNSNFPDWSPGNEWIAFVSDRDGNEEIYLASTNGNELRRLTNDPGRDIHPYFSPDGRYILFNSTRGNGSFDIYRFTLETGKTERLTNTTDDETCARYAPGMRQIVYLRNGASGDDIYVLNTASFISDNITRTPDARDGWPVFSPDGKWIFFSSMESGTFSIYKIHPDGTGLQRLTFPEPGEEDARVFVSADSRCMIYNKRTGNTIEIRYCDLED